MKHQVGIQFCGGCNPYIDRGKIASEVRERLAGEGYEIVWNRTDCDLVIFISGCTASCAERHSCGKPSIRVAAATVDFKKIAEADIGTEIMMKVANYFEKLEKPLR
jgi:hypothetical protein